MTTGIKKGSFRTLKTGAETLMNAVGDAYGAWRTDDIEECVELLRQFEADCATLGQQAKGILTDLAASVADET